MESQKVTTENKFYVYIHFRKSDGKPFYIGKGHGKRVDSKYGRNPYWNRVVAKHGLITKVLCKNMSEKLALSLEVKLIAFYSKKYELANLTKGGDGCSGYRHTQEVLDKLYRINIGKTMSTEARAKLREAAKNRTFSLETRAKIVKSLLGRKHSAETKSRISASNKGKVISTENRQKLSKLNGIRIRCIETGCIFNSSVVAANEMKLDRSAISRHIRNPKSYSQVNGFHFEKVEQI